MWIPAGDFPENTAWFVGRVVPHRPIYLLVIPLCPEGKDIYLTCSPAQTDTNNGRCLPPYLPYLRYQEGKSAHSGAPASAFLPTSPFSVDIALIQSQLPAQSEDSS